jgi:hypothetical protein
MQHTPFRERFSEERYVFFLGFAFIVFYLLRLRHLGFGEPEIIDALHQVLERAQLQGLADVGIRMQLIAFHNIPFCFRCGQDHDGDRFQPVVLFNASQNLTAVHSGHIQIEQDEIRARDINESPLALPKGLGPDTIGRQAQMDGR